MVATIVPFGSEMYFGTLLSLGKYNNFFLLVAASLGNIMGSVFNWVCGYYVNYFVKKPKNVNKKNIDEYLFFITSDENIRKAIELLHPIPRIGQPSDHSKLAAFLLNDSSNWITGQIFNIDGGRSTIRRKG